MDIDMPEYGIGLWIEGDNLAMRFPDRQLVRVPISEMGRVINVLRTRWEYAKRKERMTIGTTAAPVQHDWDLVREHLSRSDLEEARKKKIKRTAERLASERKARERRIAKRDAEKAADELLADLFGA